MVTHKLWNITFLTITHSLTSHPPRHHSFTNRIPQLSLLEMEEVSVIWNGGQCLENALFTQFVEIGVFEGLSCSQSACGRVAN